MAGYESAHDILNVKENEITILESFASTIPLIIKSISNKLNVKLTAVQELNLLRIFLGRYATESGNFKFKMGEIVLIKEIIKFGQVQLESNNHSYDIFEQQVGQATSTVKTPIGVFFGNDDYWPNLNQTTGEFFGIWF